MRTIWILVVIALIFYNEVCCSSPEDSKSKPELPPGPSKVAFSPDKKFEGAILKKFDAPPAPPAAPGSSLPESPAH